MVVAASILVFCCCCQDVVALSSNDSGDRSFVCCFFEMCFFLQSLSLDPTEADGVDLEASLDATVDEIMNT